VTFAAFLIDDEELFDAVVGAFCFDADVAVADGVVD
jgi:hypothetical protein